MKTRDLGRELRLTDCESILAKIELILHTHENV
jgi:hypothetical protein